MKLVRTAVPDTFAAGPFAVSVFPTTMTPEPDWGVNAWTLALKALFEVSEGIFIAEHAATGPEPDGTSILELADGPLG